MRKRYPTKNGVMHPMYGAKVKGIVPPTLKGAFIQGPWVEWAMGEKAERVLGDGPRVAGVDVGGAGLDSDKSVITIRKGMRVERVKKFEHQSTMETTGEIALLIQEGVQLVYLDVTGIGTGVYERLVELGHGSKVMPINFGGAAYDDPRELEKTGFSGKAKFSDLGTQMYYNIAQLLEARRMKLEYDEELSMQLLARRMEPRESNGKLKLESKKDYKERGFDSPDEADSLALAFCEVAPSAAYQEPFVEMNEGEGIESLFDR